ncbi:helix-turn-helix domain-containing protein [Methylobacterium oxalidis]|uniref:HTH cro/C1-type domain-containing protein n=1 Tax=Methylobacterium oxalidis TaxID=944322 RepID=A0A512J911_9HYPH|nr:helix-turn-helix transcriptional regulator [Methylobacterium oxalidis]GEP06454.1 hypothetical protein MOX02_44920 [Methylobacterium oxalidis]GJE33523.1 hypothetical protein LDDCCGHA_3723 [Methylobacterium oxalidis]GLS65494.1 hypothetical protein GCM10007888_38760 [Methylobacterium oxalidis]
MAGRSPSDIDCRIAARVGAARAEAGLKQCDLAQALGVSPAQFQKYEKGQNRISAGALQVLADRIGQPITAFFDTAEGC